MPNDHEISSAVTRFPRGDWPGVLFALVFPIVAVSVYFSGFDSEQTTIKTAGYALSKIVLLAFPFIWVYLVRRERDAGLLRMRCGATHLTEGALFGGLIVVASLLLHHLWLGPEGYYLPEGFVAEAIYDKVKGFGLTNSLRFVAFAVFVSLAHSLIEEYYWRWFVYGRLSRLMPIGWAVLVASLGFMTHHVVILAAYFGWASPMTWVFSAGVAIGGAYWCWLYQRSGSLLAPWLSHALVDAALFLVGYDLICPMMGA